VKNDNNEVGSDNLSNGMEPFGGEKSFKLDIHGNSYQGLGEMIGEPYFSLRSLLSIMV